MSGPEPGAPLPPTDARRSQGVVVGSDNKVYNYYLRSSRGLVILAGSLTALLILLGGAGYALLTTGGKKEDIPEAKGASVSASPLATASGSPGRSPARPSTGNSSPRGPAMPPTSERVDGILYHIGTDQNLYWSRHRRPLTGESSWAPTSGAISAGGSWGRFRLVTADAGVGIIYGLDMKGDLYWFRHADHVQGGGKVQPPDGVKVASGWGSYQRIMAAGEGIIYAFGSDGKLHWYEHLDPFGGKDSWTNNRQPKLADIDWNMFVPSLVTVYRGHFFAATPAGMLKYYYHNAWRDGDRDNWTYGYGREIGSVWDQFATLIARDAGVVYAVKPGGDLLWYRYDFDGTWYPRDPPPISTGWTANTF